MKKENNLKQQLLEQEQLATYTSELEKINQSFRSFKHDYMNILLTMNEYLNTRQYDSLTEYYQQKILPLGYGLDENQVQIDTLRNLHFPEIKGLLAGKCNYAVSQKIHLQLSIPFPASPPSIDVVSLSRILGIFLDNAIESARETETRKLEIFWYAYETKTVIIIRNSCSDSTPSIREIQQKRFSTKEGHEGIGLYNVSQLLKQYNNIHWTMKQDDHMFHQELQIFSERN